MRTGRRIISAVIKPIIMKLNTVNVYREDKSMWTFYESPDIDRFDYNLDTFKKLNKLERDFFLRKRFEKIILCLESFKKKNLFLVSKIIITSSSKVKHVSQHTTNNEIFEFLVNHVSWRDIVCFEGYTWICRDTMSQQVYGIFEFFIYVSLNYSILFNFSDCWVPASNSGMSLEEAHLNSNRLENCLKEVKEKCNFFKIEPDENEEDTDNHLYQKGFRMYISEEWMEEEDFSKFPNHSIEDFYPFMWEYRNKSV